MTKRSRTTTVLACAAAAAVALLASCSPSAEIVERDTMKSKAPMAAKAIAFFRHGEAASNTTKLVGYSCADKVQSVSKGFRLSCTVTGRTTVNGQSVTSTDPVCIYAVYSGDMATTQVRGAVILGGHKYRKSGDTWTQTGPANIVELPGETLSSNICNAPAS